MITKLPKEKMEELRILSIRQAAKRARAEATIKEASLRSACGPASLPDPHYPKSYFLKADKE